MSTIGERAEVGFNYCIDNYFYRLFGGAMLGYLYGRLAQLPAERVSAAWTIYEMAALAFESLAKVATDNVRGSALLRIAGRTALLSFAMHEMTKRGLLGEKMKVFIVVVEVARMYKLFAEAATGKKSDKTDKTLDKKDT